MESANNLLRVNNFPSYNARGNTFFYFIFPFAVTVRKLIAERMINRTKNIYYDRKDY